MAHSDSLGFSIIWTTYGTWLPGDQRGWTRFGAGKQPANPLLERWCRVEMKESPLVLSVYERGLVNRTIKEVCRHRGWECQIANARTNHVHLVVSAAGTSGRQVRDSMKAWCTRRLKERQDVLLKHLYSEQLWFDRVRDHWWAEGGYARPLFTQADLEAAIVYAGEAQDRGGSKGNRQKPGVDYLRERACIWGVRVGTRATG
ncbi:MAG: hypothetical protein F9B45_27165 [Phycisphaera sp. RhM]|nr:hypothetical protein [Phycisphaera sp. RhM]